LAELETYQIITLYKEPNKELAAKCDAGSFRELYKCVVEHKCAVFSGYNLSDSGHNLSGRNYNYNYNLCKHFEHGFGSIRAVLAELEAFQILAELEAFQILTDKCAFSNGANSLFSFYELCKCAAEHVFGYKILQFSPKEKGSLYIICIICSS
jgi:hypothetical protein